MSLILRLAIFFIAPLCYCQNPGGIRGYSLWLEPSVFNDSTIAKPKDLKEINALHFNFNPVLNPVNKKDTHYKNLVGERYSFFCVFKSDTEDEVAVAVITKGDYKAHVSNKAITSTSETSYKQANSKNGLILSLISANGSKSKKRNNISIADFYRGDKEGKQQLMEVIYYPRILSTVERRKVETYLSIKYGISIIDEADYINSAADTIWKYKANKDFSTRVTGIGHDNALNLYQKQSGNSQRDGLYIGLGTIDTTNTLNPYILKDNSFMLWGDNGKTTLLKKRDDKTAKAMERVWKMQLLGINLTDSILTQVRISKKEMDLSYGDGKDVLWLAINDAVAANFDYADARYIKQSREDESFVYFDNVRWDTGAEGSDTFTLVKGPDYFIEYEALSDCSEVAPGSVKLKICGGTAPYTIALGSQGAKTYTVSTDSYLLTGLDEGSHYITVKDSNGNMHAVSLVIDFLAGAEVTLAPVWYLDKTGNVLVSPTVTNAQGLTYAWSKQGGSPVEGNNFSVREAGAYTLEVTNINGCKKTIPFSVASANSGWAVYPNPVKSGQPFYIDFNLEKKSEASIKINSLEGKTYMQKNLGTLQHYSFTGTLITSGVYLVTLTINGVDETSKLIVE